jgi:formamidopyrimidine-DNA glycosylase
MPELPEVETIRRALHSGGRDGPPLVGRRIQKAHLLWERTLATPSPAEFRSRIAGQLIQDVGRRGKYLLLVLSSDVLLIHLRMSGDLLVESCAAPLAERLVAHLRLALDLDGDLRLVFNDPRKFGRAWLVSDPQDILDGLGPEPLSPELTPQAFYERLRPHRRQLKPLLLDQTFLAGLGNIYTDEALHLAGLHPLTIANQLDQSQASRLLASIRRVLEDGIQRQGSSIDWVYRGGDFQNYFDVYQRTGQACNHCGTPIQRIVVGQRGTHFCPDCQPLTTRS